jgi:3,4-dihydroxy 2-butanone 4-phosphate synthase/GTP cyclohydrolase II
MTSVEEAIEDYRDGRFVIIVDDADRENEGDLTMAAEFVTAHHVNFMARFARGLVCMPMAAARVDQIGLPMSATNNADPLQTPFTVPVEARFGTTTGISAADRARTIEVLLDRECTMDDLVMPGHLFPLRARQGGVLERRGQTEAVVDLCILAGLQPAGVLCEIMRTDGTMARLPDLRRFGRRHGIRIISVAQLAEYRLARL